MKNSTRRVSMFLAIMMVISMLAAFPTMVVGAADTNYASGLTATVTKAGADLAPQGGTTVAALTDGSYPTEEASGVYFFSGSGGLAEFVFDLGSVKTDVSSVYAYVRSTGNRSFDAALASVEVSSDNVTYTAVAGSKSYVANANANYYDFTYAFTAAQSARYVKVILGSDQYVLSLGEIEIRNYGLSSGTTTSSSEAESADPTLVDGNYAYGATYTVTLNDGTPAYRNTYMNDANGKWLTDGYVGTGSNIGTNYYTVAYAGTNGAYVITLSLTASHSDVKYVTLENVPAEVDSGSFCYPTNVAISTSADGISYTPASITEGQFADEGGAMDITYTFASAVTAQYIQISFTSPRYLVGMDEIVVGGDGTAPEIPSTSDSTSDEPTSSIDPDDPYPFADPSFGMKVEAQLGTFDPDGEGTEFEEGEYIAVDVIYDSVDTTVNPYGMASFEALLQFDTEALIPVFYNQKQLNGEVGVSNPLPVYSWPTYTVSLTVPGLSAPVVYDLFAVKGLCWSYAYLMSDGSFVGTGEVPAGDPDVDRKFSIDKGYLKLTYLINTEKYKDATCTGIGDEGTFPEDNIVFRHYFKAADGSFDEGETFTFTVPDGQNKDEYGNTIPSTQAPFAGTCQLYGGSYQGPEAEVSHANAYGTGDSVTFTVPSAVVAEHFTFTETADTTNVVKSEVTTNLYFKAGGISAADLKALFVDADIAITKANGTAIADTAIVGTGAIVTSTINGVAESVTVVVLGDVTGDGVVAGSDYSQVLLSVKGKKAITDTAKLHASNVVGPKADGSVASSDLSGSDYAQVLLMAKGKRTSFNTQVK
ncbi:MAG: hypothetical protein IJB76_03345 [Clostridia bacterium]|nr:hypothetical protein [Clostridia bacterium]